MNSLRNFQYTVQDFDLEVSKALENAIKISQEALQLADSHQKIKEQQQMQEES